MQAWIATGGAAGPVTVEPVRIIPPTNSRPLVMSDSESKVRVSDKELPTLQRIMFKVWWVDDVEHVLHKGVWFAMPAKCHGWEIYI